MTHTQGRGLVASGRKRGGGEGGETPTREMSGGSQGEVSAVEMMPPSQFLQEAESLPPPPPPPPQDDDSLLQAVMANRHSNPPTSVNASGSDMRLRPYDEGSGGEKPRQVDDDNGTGSYPRSQNPLHDRDRRKKAVDEDNASFCDAAGGYYHSKHSEKSDGSWGFDKYVCAIGREVGFSTWFRMYVLLLLFSNLLLCVFVGYHFMLAASYRMAAPPEDESKRIPGSFAFLSLFFIILHLASTCLHMTLRLIGCWMGFTRDSCNLFFLPNSFQVPKQSMKWRDFQLFGLAFLTLIIPFFYAVAVTLGGGDAAPYFFGHFSFCSFAIFNICYLVLYMYFWWKSIRAKKVATSKATVQMKEMQKLDRRDRSDDEDEEDEEEEEGEDEDRRYAGILGFHPPPPFLGKLAPKPPDFKPQQRRQRLELTAQVAEEQADIQGDISRRRIRSRVCAAASLRVMHKCTSPLALLQVAPASSFYADGSR